MRCVYDSRACAKHVCLHAMQLRNIQMHAPASGLTRKGEYVGGASYSRGSAANPTHNHNPPRTAPRWPPSPPVTRPPEFAGFGAPENGLGCPCLRSADEKAWRCISLASWFRTHYVQCSNQMKYNTT